jgi:peptidyl-prolyl cis-trans isomerase C
MLSIRIFRRLAVVFVLACVCFAPALNVWAETTPAAASGKVADVNGAAITQLEFDQTLRQLRGMGGGNGQQLDKLAILDKLIANELLYQESKKQGIKITAKEVDDILNKTKGDDFNKKLKEYKITEEYVKSGIEKGLAVDRLIRNIYLPKINVPETDIKKFYEDNKTAVEARHILVKVENMRNKAEKDTALAKIKAIKARLDKGEDFAKLAKEESDCPSGEKGGILGAFPRGKMVEPFEKAAFALKIGERSGIVETKFGYHIIEVTGRQAAIEEPFEKVKEKIFNFLKNQRMMEFLRTKVDEMRKGARVNIYMKN